MTVEVKVPRLPESVADATLVSWHKSAGDIVERDENLADLETDKVVLEVPAPIRGILQDIHVKGGTTVTSGQLLAVLLPAEEAAAAIPEPAVAEKVASGLQPAPAGSAGRSAGKTGPAARRVIGEKGLEVAAIAGSGPGGRITKADALAAGPVAAAAQAPNPASAASAARVVPAAGGSERTERRVPMTRLRARIAERMVEAQRSAAMLTTFNEIDLSAVLGLRARYKAIFEQQHGVKLGFMGFFVKAAIEALRRYPAVNAAIEGNEIVYHDYYDVGIAVSTDRGLIVPVLRDADRQGIPGIEAAIADFGRKARDGALGMEDLTGGTFTITNGGVFGSLLSTPILNPPQSGILGMHKIEERPMAVDGAVVIRPMMYVALTYDHRIIDGREAVQFLVAVKDALEDPARLVLGV